eukprot:scaffold70363_cov27-Phaeocystis_antarctica.AAC.1
MTSLLWSLLRGRRAVGWRAEEIGVRSASGEADNGRTRPGGAVRGTADDAATLQRRWICGPGERAAERRAGGDRRWAAMAKLATRSERHTTRRPRQLDFGGE